MNTSVAAVTNPLTGQLVDDDKLKSIATLAKWQLAEEKRVEKLENQLKFAKEQLRNIQEKLLPDAMLAIGMSSFSLDSGESISVSKFYQGKIPSATDIAKNPTLAEIKAKAFEWLREHNFDSLIKREVWLTFGKGEDKKAEAVKDVLLGLGYIALDDSTVHPQTLKAFIREQIENGQELPSDLFSVYVGNKAEITEVTK